MDDNQIEILMDRAVALLAYMDAEVAAGVLMDSGVSEGDAFLAVQAAKMLLKVEPDGLS